jgi:hypothetical protein
MIGARIGRAPAEHHDLAQVVAPGDQLRITTIKRPLDGAPRPRGCGIAELVSPPFRFAVGRADQPTRPGMIQQAVWIALERQGPPDAVAPQQAPDRRSARIGAGEHRHRVTLGSLAAHHRRVHERGRGPDRSPPSRGRFDLELPEAVVLTIVRPSQAPAVRGHDIVAGVGVVPLQHARAQGEGVERVKSDLIGVVVLSLEHDLRLAVDLGDMNREHVAIDVRKVLEHGPEAVVRHVQDLTLGHLDLDAAGILHRGGGDDEHVVRADPGQVPDLDLSNPRAAQKFASGQGVDEHSPAFALRDHVRDAVPGRRQNAELIGGQPAVDLKRSRSDGHRRGRTAVTRSAGGRAILRANRCGGCEKGQTGQGEAAHANSGDGVASSYTRVRFPGWGVRAGAGRIRGCVARRQRPPLR